MSYICPKINTLESFGHPPSFYCTRKQEFIPNRLVGFPFFFASVLEGVYRRDCLIRIAKKSCVMLSMYGSFIFSLPGTETTHDKALRLLLQLLE